MKKAYTKIILLIISAAIITGCSNKNGFSSRYEEAKQSITLKNGKTQEEMEETIKQFIRYAYSPDSQEEQALALNVIQPICTENEWNQLQNLFSYVEEEEEITDLKVYYGSGKNMTDGVSREVAVFTVNYGNGDKLSYIMTFNMNELDMISSHYIIRGVR